MPTYFLDLKAKLKYSPKEHKTDVKDIFHDIYVDNTWGAKETISGQGSTIESASNIIQELPKLLAEYDIKSILDLPCGDFNWMKEINLNNINYIGADIVTEIINVNQKYCTENKSFIELDIIKSPLPKVDLILVRDCFVHFSYDNIFLAIDNIKQSGAKYLLMTNFDKVRLNYDISTGDWRPLNFNLKPFNFTSKVTSIIESFPAKYKIETRGKELTLWEIDNLS